MQRIWPSTEKPATRPKVCPGSANDFCLRLCGDIQSTADSGSTRAMYQGIEEAFGPSITKVASLKSPSGENIKDRSKQMERWAEYYQEFFSRENVVSDKAIQTQSYYPPWKSLVQSPLSTNGEKPSTRSPAVKLQAPEIVKAGKENSLLGHLHELTLQ